MASDLADFYPFPTFLSFVAVGTALALLALITIAAFWQLKRRPYLAVGWLWFCGVMVPMSGIIHVGVQAMADRFMYVPIIGILIIVCFGAKDLVSAIAGRTPHPPLTPG